MTKDRINKETGELSASGELSVSVELKTEKVEGCCGNPELLQVLRKKIQEPGLHTYLSCDDRVSWEQREELLYKVLPLYIQVCITRRRVRISTFYFCSVELSKMNIFWLMLNFKKIKRTP